MKNATHYIEKLQIIKNKTKNPLLEVFNPVQSSQYMNVKNISWENGPLRGEPTIILGGGGVVKIIKKNNNLEGDWVNQRSSVQLASTATFWSIFFRDAPNNFFFQFGPRPQKMINGRPLKSEVKASFVKYCTIHTPSDLISYLLQNRMQTPSNMNKTPHPSQSSTSQKMNGSVHLAQIYPYLSTWLLLLFHVGHSQGSVMQLSSAVVYWLWTPSQGWNLHCHASVTVSPWSGGSWFPFKLVQLKLTAWQSTIPA